MSNDQPAALEILAAGYLFGVLVTHGLTLDELTIPTDEHGVTTGEVRFTLAGAWFNLAPTLIPGSDA